MLVVNEIFFSIQGESTHAGRPCVFVRLAYCNLRCSYCDTSYAFTEGKEMSIDDVLNTIRKYDCKLIQVTGGEPLLQSDVYHLMKRMCDEGFEVLLETGGSVDISITDLRVKRIIDFKCPSSGMVDKNLWDNCYHLKDGDEVKFVIANRVDYEWTKSVIQRNNLSDRCTVLMTVVFGVLEPRQLAKWILEDKLDVRFQLQMQKYIWSPETRGV
ncbi:MAG: radical SAM protein [Bacteroidota bacterium]|nr:radical SAM protein [Bacteroidota bacterium]